ncbi:non-ribosomal peptide synthetase, partial [Bacillus mycoides]
FEYNEDLFNESTISRMAESFCTLLEGIVTNPEESIKKLPIMSSEEQRKSLVDWNDTTKGYPLEKGMHQFFEDRVVQHPEAIAAVFEGESITYQELNRRANQLAHHLKLVGVESQAFIGIYMERSLEMLITLLAVFKAEGVYVPLDPSYPKDRITFMLEDSQTSVILTQRQLVSKLPNHDVKVICADADWDQVRQCSDSNLPRCGDKDSLAYTIYTSGSTGKPKGVQITNDALINCLLATNEHIQLNEQDRFLAVATISFDIACVELYLPLILGACVVIAKREVSTDGECLAELINTSGATIMQATPATWQMLIQAGWNGNLQLKVLTGGEALPLKLANDLIDRSAGVWNGYGPTEATIYTTISKVTTEDSWISIGRPIANTSIYVLDDQLQPVPVGVPGELHIGGSGLAAGYLNRPELTAERFIQDPFSNKPNARMYKTGDLVRYRSNGELEFISRIDHQVKVRGFRIELGEIENVLIKDVNIKEVVVIVHEDVLGEKRLVAYVVPNEKQSLNTKSLRSLLKGNLPDYMIPSAFIVMDKFPLTLNGKIDRQALPMPEKFESMRDKDFVAPRNRTEELLADIWCTVLQVDKVGIDDNFFEMGGHSLLATQVLWQLREVISVDISVRDLFTYPNIEDLALYIETVQRGGTEDLILPISRDKYLPVSSSQKRLWFLSQMELKDKHLYNIPIALLFKGKLEYSALVESLNEIIRRHENLRTTFVEQEGKLGQIITPFSKMEIPFTDLSRYPKDKRRAEAKHLINQEARYSFDFSRGPLCRVNLIKMETEEHILLINLHHIISDGWSHDIFMQELSALYTARIAGESLVLPDLPIQYVDFAAWEQEWLEGERLEESLAYWKKQLGGKLPVLQLPSDRPRPAVQTFRGKTKKFKIPNELLKKVKVLSQEERSSLFMTLLTGFKVLLYRYTGQEDLLVGTPVANRNQKALENLIGFFANTLVVRTDISGDVSFRDLLRRVREVTLEAYAHQDVPFEKLVDELNVERDLSHSPLFQVMFMFRNIMTFEKKLSGLHLQEIDIDRDVSKFDLTLFVEEEKDELQGIFEYNEDLFNESTISRMAESFCTLLEGIVTNPEESIKKLPIMSSEEQRKSLVDWNDTTKGYPLEKGMHQFFEDRVVQHPEAIAAVFEGESITYQELNRRANQLAHHLKLVGVESQAFIGIYMERSLEMLITLLAVFKAEGVYVPLDPSYPKDRITFMLEDSQTSVILTQRQLVSKLPNHDVKVICADADWDQVRQCSDSNLPRCGDKDSLAYTIYTSGSTGKPKGVQITNDALINCLLATNEHIQLNEQDRFLAVATISFDIACVELYLPLILGACVVIAKREVSTDGECLAELINTSGATIMQATPATWQMLIQAGWNGNLQLKVLTGGEALPLKLANDLIDRSAGVWNGYGPTEATIYTTISKVTTEDSWISIGRPIANTSIYVLDDQLQPVPVGVPGELHIGGSGLAAGYLNRPELTAERFIQDPFSNKPNARMYKTGDLVRYRSNGELEFISRIDHQVKVRGFRIELGEIENVLIKDVNIKEVVVIVHEDVLGEKRLVAYVVPNEKQSLNTKSLRSLLKGNLPDYMIPSAFIVMDKFPLTLNGKIDRQALPMPEKFESMRDKDFVAPRNRTEELLADIWCTVLQVDKVGIDDNFFEMGGHSLLATQVLWQLR